jgi:hypothetical protein
MRTHFLHPGHRKKLLGRSRVSDVLSRRMALRTHNLSSRRLKSRLWWSMKKCFKVSKGQANSFAASWTLKKATWTKSLKRCFK